MIGSLISHYRVEERRGGGGMGVVYRAVDILLERDVALKFLAPGMADDESARRRFLQEARAAASLDHENVCGVHEVGEAPDGSLFIVMDWCDGESLREVLRRSGALPPRDAASICLQAARALQAAHAGGIVHRDVKPGNIMVGMDGRVRVVDFGLAKLAEASAASRSGMAAGTIAYMAPERIRGGEAGPASDIWALGAVLYECLSGERAYPGESEQSVAMAILKGEPRPLPSLKAGLPGSLCRVVDAALEREPSRRPASMAALASALEGALAEIDAGTARPARRRLSKRALRTGAIVLASACALGLVGWAAATAAQGRARGDAVAVLPFTAPTKNEADLALVGLIRENLEAALVQAGGLRVVEPPEGSADEFSAARAAGASWLLDGSVIGAEGRFRITSRLVDLRTREHLWADSFDRPASEILAVQGEIVTAIVRATRGATAPVKPGWFEKAKAEQDPRVMDLLMRASGYSLRSDRSSMRQSWKFLSEAVGLAPANPELRGGRGWKLFQRVAWLAADLPPDAWPAILGESKVAQSSDPYWADGPGLQGMVALYGDRDYGEAARLLARATALPLGEASYIMEKAWCELAQGLGQRAIATASEAVAANGTDWNALAERVRVEVAAGKPEAASSHLDELLAYDPAKAESRYAEGLVRLAQGRFPEAFKAFDMASRAAGGSPVAAAMAALSAARGGDRSAIATAEQELAARKAAWERRSGTADAGGREETDPAAVMAMADALTDAEAPAYVPDYAFALLSLAKGDRGAALSYLSASASRREPQALRALFEPGWEALRADGSVVSAFGGKK